MEYRLDKQTLLEAMRQWNGFLKRKIHLIACGGTALTLMKIKPSTKDVDFMVPDESEYGYLVKTLKSLGYRQVTGGDGTERMNLLYLIFFLENAFIQQNCSIHPWKQITTNCCMNIPESILGY